MDWAPQQQILQHLVVILTQSLSPSNSARTEASKALEHAKTQPDLENYLTYIFLHNSTESSVNLRASAGLLLKNDVRHEYSRLPTNVLTYIKQNIISGLQDPNQLIRNVSGTVITTLFSCETVTGWPDLLPGLISLAELSSDPQIQEASMSALGKICEDSASELDRDYNGQRPVSFMIPKLLKFAEYSSPRVRSQSVFCLTQFIILQSEPLLAEINTVLGVLFSLSSDSNPDIRRNVCSAFVHLLDATPEKLLPHLSGVINYCLDCMRDEDEQVALEGCEFILGLAESKIEPSQIQPYLPSIVPTILTYMVYSGMDQFILEGMAEDDEDIEDKPEDIRPVNAKARDAHSLETKGNSKQKNPQANGGSNNENGEADEDDDDDYDDDEDDDDDVSLSEWNLRKCSAAALDVLSTKFPSNIVDILLPHLQTNIVSEEWPIREAAILAFGAIAEGCIDLVGPHLQNLIPFLVERLSDSQAPVRQISCWTLGRYSPWIVLHSHDGTAHQTFFLPVLQGLLKCSLDKNKKVQKAGCSGFATFAESAGDQLSPYLEPILTHLTICFKKYQSQNLFVLYDALQTLVDKVSTDLNEERYVQILLPPLIEKWGQLSDDDMGLWPLLECMSSVTAALGESFLNYAPPVFERCIKILRDNLIQEQNFQVDPSLDPPQKDFIITSIDLIDGLIQGLKGHASKFIQASNPPLVEMLLACFQDSVYEVRQSAFALLGDMAIYTYDQLQPYLDSIMRDTIPQIDISDSSAHAVCNNAIWASGEIALRAGQGMEPYLQDIFTRLVTILLAPTVPTVRENAAIAIGRLGISLADQIAPHLSHFVTAWCENIKDVQESDEKDSAFRGICGIVAVNPGGVQNEDMLALFFVTVGGYVDPSPQLADLIRNVLSGYKELLAANWTNIVSKRLPTEIASHIHHRYGL